MEAKCEKCSGPIEEPARENPADRCAHCADKLCWSCCPAPSEADATAVST
jgi:hypothetical protein